ncbi:MAG: amino acid adenylation domain-containing protein [Vicinamibacterales bacterium]
MSLVDLLARLRALDVRVWLDGGRLRVSAPPGVLTSALQQEIAAAKPELIALLNTTEAGGDGAVPRLDRASPLPLSYTQERMWVLHELEPDSRAYHVIQADRLRGPFDAGALGRAWARLLERQEVLRTRILAPEGVPHVVVDDAALPAAFRIEDLTGRDAAAADAALDALLRDETRRPFDLAAGPLAALVLVRMAAEDHVLIYRLHHLVTDHWSLGVLRQELSALYGSEVTGQPADLADLPVQYVDFAAWQRAQLEGERWKTLLAFWRARLDHLEPLVLPAVAGRDERGAGDRDQPGGGSVTVPLPDRLLDRLTAVAGRMNATLFMVLVAAFLVLLHRYTGRSDLAIGTPVSGRTRGDVEALAGAFINTLVLRATVRHDDRFTDLLDRVRQVTLDAFAHQDAPFERLVAALVPARDGTATPLVQVMFNLLNAQPAGAGFPHVTAEALPVDRADATLDISLLVDLGARTATIEYRDRVTTAEGAGLALEHYRRLLEGIADDPARPVARLPLLGAWERGLLDDLNQTEAPIDPDVGVEALVARQVARTPEAIAVRAGDRALSYAELDRRAGALAAILRRRGVGPGTLVGVCLQRSEAVPVALLAVLRAGGAYLPLDPDFPRSRLALMVEDARLGLALVDPSGADVLGGCPGLRLLDLAGDPLGDDAGAGDDLVNRAAAGTGIRLGEDAEAPCGEDLAYVLYTSGSTGRPKGVQIPRRALANLIQATAARPGLGPGDTLLAVTTLSFDIAALEIWLPLSVGGTVAIATRQEASDGHALLGLLSSHGVTAMQATPATWRLLIDAGWTGQPPIKVLCGGEAMPADLAAALTARSPEVWNLYGPTETTIWSTAERIEPGRSVGIGRPLANTQVYVLDAGRQQVPPGVTGELHIGGLGVARGYVGRPELTAAAFVPDWFSGRSDARLYRTGDLGRVMPDGRLEFQGRADGQIKLRGFRIEPAEIEAALMDHPAVGQAAVAVRDRAGEPVLVAWLTGRHGEPPPADALRAYLADRLPAYMVPAAYAPIDALPLTPNGKLDRRALPAALPDAARTRPSDHAITGTARRLAALWTDILKVDQVGAGDDFFALGGHSLLAMRLVALVEKTFDVRMPPGVLFEHPELGELADWIDGHTDGAAAPVHQPVLVQIEAGGDGLPFFWVHGVGGEVFTYMQLSRHLGRSRPVYGFTADWTVIAGDEPLTLEMMAQRYIQELREVQPRGPYNLGGFCSASMLALEMACQLEATGERVGIVALDYQLAPDQVSPTGLRAAAAFLRNLPRWYFEDAVPSGRRELLGRVRSGLSRIYGRLVSQARRASTPPRPVDVRDQLGMWRFPAYQVPMLEAHHRAISTYQPRPFRGRIALFLPSAAPLLGPWPRPSSFGWDKLAQGGLHVHVVKGSHSTMLVEPFATELAGIIAEHLRETEVADAPAAARASGGAA